MKKTTEIVKSSGKKVSFSISKLENSLRRSGAKEALIKKIVNTVRDELYQGISTKEIYNRAYTMLQKEGGHLASKYKLKKAIYELGPTGFPFEKFVAAIFANEGYHVAVGKTMSGKCVDHEVDIEAKNETKNHIVAECKFHGEEGRNCDVKIPLYIHARFQDIAFQHKNTLTGYVVTNTRFSKDAEQFALCAGLHLLSWDYPKGNGLKDKIDLLKLYPITVSTLLSKREKQFLLSRDVVLCKDLLHDRFYLDHLGISENRKKRILNEIECLCKIHTEYD